MADLLDLSSWKLGTADLIQQMAMLVWMNKGDDGKDMMQKVTHGRVMYELYNRLTPERQVEQWQQECLLGIVEYIKKNPKATEASLVREVTKHVEIFKQKAAAL